MARKLRVEYRGAIYHVINRGDRREPIFKDDEGRQRFLSTLGEASQKTGWQGHSYCLMPNHFHLVVETPQPTLREQNKGDLEKLKIAVRLRNETLMTVAWIAQRLQMGSVANVNTLLYQWRQGKYKN